MSQTVEIHNVNKLFSSGNTLQISYCKQRGSIYQGNQEDQYVTPTRHIICKF